MNALLLTILGALLNVVLIVLWTIIRAEVKRTLQDINGVSRKLTKVIAFLVRSEDLNPAARREQLTAIIEGK